MLLNSSSLTKISQSEHKHNLLTGFIAPFLSIAKMVSLESNTEYTKAWVNMRMTGPQF